jgi:cyclophilin family peptidyl-prolyl cis-trans isomerase
VPSADKRARKKENARAAREQREQAEKRRKRIRSTSTIAVVGVVFVGLIVILNVTGNDKKKSENGCSTSVPSKGDKQTFSKPDLPTLDPAKTYIAAIETSCGTFNITLDAKDAPKAAGNFVFLAKKGFYDGVKFNRAAEDFVVQVGDYEGDTSGDAGYTITTETPKTPFATGDVGWAKGGNDPPGTAQSQFFVVTGKSVDALNQKVGGKIQYAKFGKVTSGLDVAQKINSFAPPGNGGQPGDGPPTQDVYIDKVTITET